LTGPPAFGTIPRHMEAAHLHLVAPRGRRGALEDSVARLGLAVELGLLAPGDRLPDEAELADAFGVAPITMRRAMLILCERRVLVRRRGRAGGTFVAPRPPHQHRLAEYQARLADIRAEVWDLLDYRLTLETGSVYLAVARASDEEVARLAALVDAMDAARDWPEFRSQDPRFHLTIASMAGPQRAVDELADVLRRLAPLYFPHPLTFLRETNREHRAMVEAIARRDAAAAAGVVSAHLRQLRTDLLVDPPGDPS
jgi:GntR family transcriptional regulator, transcriptional repressor for pyruvate dehydrogenase complex